MVFIGASEQPPDRAIERHGQSHQYEGEDAVPGAIPLGGIILWSGTVATIPHQWALCDGNNGTPNLEDQFVVGAGNTYNPGDSGSTGVTLTHTANHTGAGVNNHADHGHAFGASVGVPAGAAAATAFDATSHTNGVDTLGARTHTVTQPDAHGNHSITAGSILPPYYALAYIMRIK